MLIYYNSQARNCLGCQNPKPSRRTCKNLRKFSVLRLKKIDRIYNYAFKEIAGNGKTSVINLV